MIDLDFARRFPDSCCTEVSRKGESQPCDRPACGVIVGDDDGEQCGWPVCAFHARQGRMVSLATLLGKCEV